MPLIPKPNYNQIFASQAPDQDKPAVFNNYPEGWGPESRPNNGKPTIKGFNYLQQTSDLKDLWILQNGACLPYDESIEYADGAPVLKDGVIQYKTASGFKSRDAVTIPTYNSAADGVDPVTGVADGAYFNVRSSSDESYVDEYQNVGGVPTPSGKSYPSSNAKWDASFVIDGDESQHQINSTTIRTVGTIADLLAIQNPKDGDVVFVKGLQGGTFTFDSNKANITDNIVTFNGWVRKIDGFVTPFMAGAKGDGSFDDSQALQIAINYAQDNNLVCWGVRKNFYCNNVVFGSNLTFVDANLFHNKFDTNLNSILTTEEDTFDLSFVENVYFKNVHLDGQREKHTGLPYWSYSEDGGRHGFRFVRPVKNITLENCSAHNCPVEGLIIYPKLDSTVRESLEFKVIDFNIIDSKFNWNGRHGGSADSIDGLYVTNSDFKFNGRHLVVPIISADLGKGTSARVVKDTTVPFGYRTYGAGFDIEEYFGFSYSRNITLRDCNMAENAGAGLGFVRTGSVNASCHNILISGGHYTTGVDTVGTHAITFTAYAATPNELYYVDTRIENIMSDGDINVLRSNIYVSRLNNSINPVGFNLQYSTVFADRPYLVKNKVSSEMYVQAQSPINTFTSSVVRARFGELNTNYDVQLTINNDTNSQSNVLAMDSGASSRGGIGFVISSSGDVDTTILGRYSNKRLTIKGNNGSLIPIADNAATVGTASNRFSTVYAGTGTISTSDERLKQQFRTLHESEKLAAQEIKKSICLFKFNDAVDLKGDGARWHVGVKAQEVISILEAHGLDPFEYGFVCFDEWGEQEEIIESWDDEYDDDGSLVREAGSQVTREYQAAGSRYAIRYDELIMFILASI